MGILREPKHKGASLICKEKTTQKIDGFPHVESSAGIPGSCPNDNDRTKQLSVMGSDLDLCQVPSMELCPQEMSFIHVAPKCIEMLQICRGGVKPGKSTNQLEPGKLEEWGSVACLAISGCSENRDNAHDDQWLGSIATSNHKMSKNSPFTILTTDAASRSRSFWILKVDGILS